MSIAQDTKIRELEERIQALEMRAFSLAEPVVEPEARPSLDVQKIWGEIKTIKMRMARNDGKRTPSAD